MSSDLEMQLGELRARVERLESRVFALSKPRVNGRTQFQQVLDVLENHPGEFLTTKEIAWEAQLDWSAVRMVMSTRKELFETFRVTPGRVKFRLKPPTQALSEVPA